MPNRYVCAGVFAPLACFAAMSADAQDSERGPYYAALMAEVDDQDSSNFGASLGIPLGLRGWLMLSGGTSDTNLTSTRIDTTVASLAAGFDSDLVEVGGSYAYRKDSDSFEQHDLRGHLTLVMTRVSLGLDVFHRSSEGETVTSIERRRRDPLVIRIVESVEGSGFGAHATFRATDALRLFVSGMAYDYDSETEGPAYLDYFPRLNLRVSGVTREEAYFDSSLRAGLSYDFTACTLTTTYLRDEATFDSEFTDTFEVSLDIPVGEQWAIAPWIGRSSNDSDGDILFGGLSISVVW